MPEMTLVCDGEEYVCASVSVQSYRRYTEIMEKNTDESTEKAMQANTMILSEVFGIPQRKVEESDSVEFLATVKTVHFVMQDIITKKFLELNPDRPDQVEQEKSAFDEYDQENGYADEELEQGNVWRTCRENVDRVVKMCINVLKNSYSQCMKVDIISLLDHLAFEIRTIKEK